MVKPSKGRQQTQYDARELRKNGQFNREFRAVKQRLVKEILTEERRVKLRLWPPKRRTGWAAQWPTLLRTGTGLELGASQTVLAENACILSVVADRIEGSLESGFETRIIFCYADAIERAGSNALTRELD